ncbi:alpha/beta-hydrolase [Glonium stellatum]|uniref:Acyl-protein thioesterase 1 n=1 Tax=Glonium stellatum TaxID=574774 RepID=A0A8E2ERA9_9PEZI|nr:alpha/beta-hydrolase [Glonium stellatum]
MSSARSRTYPEPLIFPSTATHTHTLIMLHGLGSNVVDFSTSFLSACTSSNHTLQQLFPGLKFVFPIAKKRRAVLYNRSLIKQWFDDYSLEDPTKRQELMYDGLRESASFVHGLIRSEQKLIGARNVVLGGLSQGCAMGLHALLSFERDGLAKTEETDPLGGFIGISGWLPLAHEISEEAWPAPVCEDQDFFANDKDPREIDTLEKRQMRAANFVRGIVELPALSSECNKSPCFARTLIFLGHGTSDDKVDIRLGEHAYRILERLEAPVTWKMYDFGHWWKEPEEIDDIVSFLQEKVGMLVM